MASNKKGKAPSAIYSAVFALYLALLIYGLFFAESFRDTLAEGYKYNFIPFREITRFIRYASSIGYIHVFINLCGNVLVFMPFGYFVPTLFGKQMKWWQMMLVTMAFSIAVELVQLVTKVGCCDVDDVILNTLGGVLGFLLYAGVRRHRRNKKGKKK